MLFSPNACNSASLTRSTPVPEKEELLTKEEAIRLIEDHLKKRTAGNRSWFRKTTMYTIIEDHGDRGRAIVASPLHTVLALDITDRIDKKTLNWIQNRTWLPNEKSETNEIATHPANIFEFSYDYTLSPEKRFCALHYVYIPTFYLTNPDLSDHWIEYCHFMQSPFAGPVTKNPAEIEAIGDPIGASYRHRIPKTHPVKYYDDIKLADMILKRSATSIFRLIHTSEYIRTRKEDIFYHMDWLNTATHHRYAYLSVLPRLIQEVTDKSPEMSQELIRYGLFDSPYEPTPDSGTSRITHLQKSWEHIREAFDTLSKKEGGTTIQLVHDLLFYLGSGLNSEKRPGQVKNEDMISFVNDFFDRDPDTKEYYKKELLLCMFNELNSPYRESDPFFASSLQEGDMSDSRARPNDDFRSLTERSSTLRGYVEIFGRPGELALTHDWYMALPYGEYENPYPSYVQLSNGIHPSPCSFLRVPRISFSIILTMFDHFTVDKEHTRGGDRMDLARALINTESEECVKKALSKNLVTKADLNRTLKWMLKVKKRSTLIPYLTYVTKKGE